MNDRYIMTVKLLVLFLTPFLAGLLIFLVPKGRNTNYRMLLVFAGSYLFAITVIHILPELYQHTSGVELMGLFVLAGFFLQQLLEYFTSGVEHGHIHTHERHEHNHHQNARNRQHRVQNTEHATVQRRVANIEQADPDDDVQRHDRRKRCPEGKDSHRIARQCG